MHIFIDESGSFTVPSEAKKPAVSAVGAVLLPSLQTPQILAEFKRLSSAWASENGEVKGRLLDEAQVDRFLGFLADCDGLVECTAIDLALHRVSEIRHHQEIQARKITANLTSEHHPNVWAGARALASRLRRLSVPGYVQLVSYSALLEAILREKTMYVVQRRPDDLGTLAWTLDAKGQPITEMESLWSFLVKPFLQSSSLQNPMAHLDWCDYSAFDRAFQSDREGLPDYLAAHARPSPRTRKSVLDINRLLADLNFAASQNEPGLQMADIATNAIRRMLVGNLQESGWRRLARVMVQPERGSEVVHMIALTNQPRSWARSPYISPLRTIRAEALPMVAG